MLISVITPGTKVRKRSVLPRLLAAKGLRFCDARVRHTGQKLLFSPSKWPKISPSIEKIDKLIATSDCLAWLKLSKIDSFFRENLSWSRRYSIRPLTAALITNNSSLPANHRRRFPNEQTTYGAEIVRGPLGTNRITVDNDCIAERVFGTKSKEKSDILPLRTDTISDYLSVSNLRRRRDLDSCWKYDFLVFEDRFRFTNLTPDAPKFERRW
jgi:hypothetical protein